MPDFIALAPLGTADLLAAELVAMGVAGGRERAWGVTFSGSLADAYRVCLWSRVASRVLLRLGSAPAATPEALYTGARGIDWSQHVAADATLAVDFDATRSAITHTRYGALKVKDAIVDQLRELRGSRPNVATERPDVRVNVRVVADEAVFAIDLAGESLHRRGWRGAGVAAPLKENLAAALLLRCGWPAVAAAGGAFVDPMCGSGTLPIEAATMAADIAPGLGREYFGFLGWSGHDAAAWESLRAEAQARRAAAPLPVGRVFGSDQDGRAIELARAAAVRAGVDPLVTLERRTLAELRAPGPSGLVLVNPPYGERLGEAEALKPLYAQLGTVLRERFDGWQAGVFTGNPALGRELGLEARRRHRMFNGPIEAQLLRFEVGAPHYSREYRPGRLPPVDPSRREAPGAQMFANRLRKNLEARGRWAQREGIRCYRVYDADMPEYAFAVDLYGNGLQYAYVQEYAAPPTVPEERVRSRRAEVVAVLPQVLGLDDAQIWFRTRRRQRGAAQYNKVAAEQAFHEVAEGGLKFLVNFDDYLDTGLFLDHRPVRSRLRELAAGRRFLNLFGYTGSATVYAAAGGAQSTTTVDLSRTYLDWARRNLELNGFRGREHVLVQADVIDWLERAPAGGWDLVFLDPPTFSNSKRMTGTLDVQRDHVALLRAAARVLAPGGLLVFSTNYSRFALDPAALPELQVEDISRATIPKDFERSPRIHRCFLVRRVAPAT
ncbi:MAG: bifunctional 23S rRNA (guanine(2069)-N(7))-methyltransferase RlmK/23S rRNA (guanine(2445)-N(2))-methyltransferase RlmL [Proteobacteria bacterium]|nr:bifunctional 23S rRNA (guanine(2069)-N(7))-methyltransferase RlmK/23S rRNA (guanine(2445)-N(2))-methyltransferase RlmL [Pseudomonadota bacterium]